MKLKDTGLPQTSELQAAFNLGYGTVIGQKSYAQAFLGDVYYKETSVKSARLLFDIYGDEVDQKALALCLALPANLDPVSMGVKFAFACDTSMPEKVETLHSLAVAMEYDNFNEAAPMYLDMLDKPMQDYIAAMSIVVLNGPSEKIFLYDASQDMADSIAISDGNETLGEFEEALESHVRSYEVEKLKVLINSAMLLVPKFDQIDVKLRDQFDASIDHAVLRLQKLENAPNYRPPSKKMSR